MTEQPDLRTFINLLSQANELRRQTDYQAAIALYRKLIEQFGESADLFAVVAHCYFAIALSQYGTDQDCFQTIIWMEKAIALEPKAHLYADLGQFHSLATVNYEQAVQAYRKTIELDSNNLSALTGMASLYGVPEEVVTLNEAIDWLERATQLAPDNSNYHAYLGKLYYEAGRASDAKREWLRALLCPQPLDAGYVQTIEDALRTGDS